MIFFHLLSLSQDVLDVAVTLSIGNLFSTPATAFVPNMTPNSKKPTLARSASELSQTRLSKVSSLKYNPTFSVRGAT